MKPNLNIIIVGYNEEPNLPMFFKGLSYLRSQIDCRVIYVDQSSSDKSLEIAKTNNCETYLHPNLGYADPDKKRAFEELCQDNERCLILDCDEQLDIPLSNEIIEIVDFNGGRYSVYKVKRINITLGGNGGETYEIRLFRKACVKLTSEIHNYVHPNTKEIGVMRNTLIHDDRKYRLKEIYTIIEKFNRYSDIELQNMFGLNKIQIIWNMFRRPIQWFFGFGIVHKQFIRGMAGIILCILMSSYQFLIYAKLYERKYIKYSR